MFAKPILFALIAACGVPSNTVTTSPDGPLGGDPDENAKAAAAARDFFDRQMQTQMQLQAASNPATAPDEPDKNPPEDPGLEDQHFCCQSISEKEFSGDGCTAISKEQINSCPNVLYCPDAWKKKDGNVTCE